MVAAAERNFTTPDRCLKMVSKKTDQRYSAVINSIGYLMGLAVAFTADPAVSAERLAVSALLANIRSGPGTTDDILWQTEIKAGFTSRWCGKKASSCP